MKSEIILFNYLKRGAVRMAKKKKKAKKKKAKKKKK